MIDFDHWKGSQIGDEISNQLDLERRLSIISALKPTLSKEGNQWCYLYGQLTNNCIVGFGDTVHNAMNDFVFNFYNQKP